MKREQDLFSTMKQRQYFRLMNHSWTLCSGELKAFPPESRKQKAVREKSPHCLFRVTLGLGDFQGAAIAWNGGFFGWSCWRLRSLLYGLDFYLQGIQQVYDLAR